MRAPCWLFLLLSWLFPMLTTQTVKYLGNASVSISRASNPLHDRLLNPTHVLVSFSPVGQSPRGVIASPKLIAGGTPFAGLDHGEGDQARELWG